MANDTKHPASTGMTDAELNNTSAMTDQEREELKKKGMAQGDKPAMTDNKAAM